MPTRPRWRRLAPALLLPLVGCAGSSGNVDLLEARLRDQQDLVARYEKLADATQQELTVARKESELLRTQLAQAGASPLLPEHADVLLRAEKLQFHQLMTGARNIDSAPGDDVLNVVIAPQSLEGETIHLVGDLEIEALDLSRPEGQQHIGRWTYTAEQARELWHAGFLASGFQMDLAWDSRPQSPEVLLHARLKTADGRQLDTTHQIQVELPIVQTAAVTGDAPRIEPQRIKPVQIEAAMPVQPLVAAEPPPAVPAIVIEPQPSASPAPAATEVEPPQVAVQESTETAEVAPFPLIELPPVDAVTSAPPVATAAAAPGKAPVPESAAAFPDSAPTAPVPPPEDVPVDGLVDAPDFPVDSAPVEASPVEVAPSVAAAPAADFPMIEPQSTAPATNNAEPAGRATVQMGVAIEPLPTPQRYRRTGRAEVPPPADIPAATHPQPADAAAAPGIPDAAPFPIDVTQPRAVDVTITPTSVRWTDDSIPYLR